MARTTIHELSTRLLGVLDASSLNGTFEGKLRSIADQAGLNSVRSAEAVKLLEDLHRIEVIQRGRRGRDTIVTILSTDPVTLEEAQQARGIASGRRPSRMTYEDIGSAVIDRLLEISRDDGLRSAQVEAFASENAALKARVTELEEALDETTRRETALRIELSAARTTLERGEENMRKVMGGDGHGRTGAGTPVADDDARAVLDVLRGFARTE